MKKAPIIFVVFAIAFSFFIIQGCNKNEPDNLKEQLKFEVPDGWPTPHFNFDDNPITNAKFELGRKLFYDARLSRTNTVSCGTCHQQFAAFAQLDHNLSHGVEDRLGTRNSPVLFNLMWHENYFWDGGANHLEVQPLDPIMNPDEMDESLSNIIDKLSTDSDYATMFTEAFGDKTITTERMMKSLAQFMGLMISKDAKYDKVKRGEATFTATEEAGYVIYKSNCAGCHTEPLFSDFSMKSNGLPVIPLPSGFIDSGRAGIPPYEASNLYIFKVPSLRNLKFSFPFMHDGRFNTLEEVLDHYAEIDSHAINLHPSLKYGIQLTSKERSELLAFLNTLNDSTFVTNSLFSEP